MRISPRHSGPFLILFLHIWILGPLQVEGLRFTVDSWTGIVTGKPFLVTWTGASTGTLTLSLENGTQASPNFLNNIKTGISSNAYTWYPGNQAIPGQPFFLKIADKAGTSALGDTFTVAATASTSSTPTSIITSTTSSPTQTGTATPSTSGADANGLSTGAKAGIGIGVALGAVGVISVLAFLFLRRRKQKRATNEPYELMENDIPGRTMEDKKSNVLAQTGPPVELMGTTPIPERLEMEGDLRTRYEM